MDNLATPDSIIGELEHIRAEAAKGGKAQYDAEIKWAKAQLELETATAKALLSSQGTAQERDATAKIMTGEERWNEKLTKAEYNRVKTKIDILKQAQMSVQTQSKMVELMYHSAGKGAH